LAPNSGAGADEFLGGFVNLLPGTTRGYTAHHPEGFSRLQPGVKPAFFQAHGNKNSSSFARTANISTMKSGSEGNGIQTKVLHRTAAR
jgi:hypothetical protein